MLNLPVAIGLDLLADISWNYLAAIISQSANLIVLGGKPIRNLLIHHPVVALAESLLVRVLNRLIVSVGGVRQCDTWGQFPGPQHIHNVIGQA